MTRSFHIMLKTESQSMGRVEAAEDTRSRPCVSYQTRIRRARQLFRVRRYIAKQWFSLINGQQPQTILGRDPIPKSVLFYRCL